MLHIFTHLHSVVWRECWVSWALTLCTLVQNAHTHIFLSIDISYSDYSRIKSYPAFILSGNPLLLNSSTRPEQTYNFRDSVGKELFDPLPDTTAKVQSSFTAEYHAKTYPQGLASPVPTNNGPYSTYRTHPRSSGVFGHQGGRLVMPNAGNTNSFSSLWNLFTRTGSEKAN